VLLGGHLGSAVVRSLVVTVGTVPVTAAPSPPVDNSWARMIDWMIRGKIIRTVLCCIVLYTTICTHTHEQFLKLSVGLGL